MRGRQDGRLLRYGLAAIAVGAWVACAPAQGTAWADTPASDTTSSTADTDPKPSDATTKVDPQAQDSAADADTKDESKLEEPDLDAEITDPDVDEPTTTPEPPAEPADPPEPVPAEPTDTAVDEPVTTQPVVEETNSSTRESDPPKQEPPHAEVEANPAKARAAEEVHTAAVATLTPAAKVLALDALTPASTRMDTTAPAPAAVVSPTVDTTPAPAPPQPLSPIAELLEVPGRVVNAVLQVFGFTTSANVPVSPITFAPINDAIFGAFRELERHLGLWQTPAPQPVVPTMTYTGDTTRPTPTVAQFLNASAAGYVLGSTPGGLVPLTVDGFQMSSTNVFSGMVGKAWVTPEGQVIIAYQGTTGGSHLLFNPLITIAQVLADLQVVFTGTTPLAFHDALDFAEQVRAEAALQGYSDEDIFVTGHSLGGWEAQYVAQQTGLAGVGFEAPGINTVVPGNGADSMFVNIGTYGSSAPYMSTDLPGLQPFMPPYVPGGGAKPHYGPIIMIGDPTAMTPLYNASQLWGTSPIGSAVFLVDYLMNFFQYHLPGVQAYHLDVTPDPGIVLWLGTARGPVHTGYGDLTIPQLMKAASDDGILFRP
ncbi:hypothetical protein EWR22_28685 [Mycolicibacterium monacense DSM 44395]|nr:hypothetical protein [Mycolicibacterium monacense]QHP89494.1 hypothetical protein EWR22_28685 [Mycolicibacterium monacense DSM 44395]